MGLTAVNTMLSVITQNLPILVSTNTIEEQTHPMNSFTLPRIIPLMWLGVLTLKTEKEL